MLYHRQLDLFQFLEDASPPFSSEEASWKLEVLGSAGNESKYNSAWLAG